MDSPYRSAPETDDVEAPRDRGIVGDVVAQFADRFAFYRELVQNAIDAGTPTVEVELRHDAAAGAIRAIVRDRGEGMDRDILENSLLVLFRSTKDKDPTKIGKFGIGFASVLAPEPRVVVVDTVRAGRRLTLHLHPDLSYQLFEGGPATRAGTAVELEIPIAVDAVADFVARSHEALARWCRHAAVPIELRAYGAGGEPLAEARIDGPLALVDAVVEVRGVSADGATTVVVGIPASGRPYAGFFNRGLMLHETAEPLVAGVAFKVLDARLGHTLSRDDVRRDAALARGLALVRELAGRPLRDAAATALAAAAADDLPRWRTLFAALDAADVDLAPAQWVVPLAAPIGEATALAAVELPRRRAWAARARTPLVDALAEAGIPVVALAAPGLPARVARSCERALLDVDAALTLVTAVPPAGADLALLDGLARLLDRAHRAPPAILLGELAGALAAAPWLAGDGDDAMVALDPRRWVVDLELGRASPFTRLRRRALVLNVDHALTAAARRRAAHAPIEAAAALARALLLHHGALDDDASLALLTATVDHLELRGPGGAR